MTRSTAPFAFALALCATAALADKPAPKSPPESTSATIGAAEVKVTYHAPSMRGRKIFGELVPFGQVWRTGANQATTLTTSADLMLKDLKVPKGSYTLFTVPAESGWTLIVNKQTGQWGTVHDAGKDLGKVAMDVAKTDAPVEKLQIKLEGGDSGKLTVAWENASASVPIAVAK